jgi:hypothetical protein
VWIDVSGRVAPAQRGLLAMHSSAVRITARRAKLCQDVEIAQGETDVFDEISSELVHQGCVASDAYRVYRPADKGKSSVGASTYAPDLGTVGAGSVEPLANDRLLLPNVGGVDRRLERRKQDVHDDSRLHGSASETVEFRAVRSDPRRVG